MLVFRQTRCFSRLSSMSKCYTLSCGQVRRISTSETSCQKEEPDFYDIIISGGGMVGGAMAAALGHMPMFENQKILMLEGGTQKPFTYIPENYTMRTCALSPATKQLLTGIGVWQDICNMRLQPVKRMQVWEACSDSMIAFQNDELTDNLAYIVENDIIQAAINKQLDKVKDRVEVRYDSKVRSYTLPTAAGSTGHSWAHVELENGDKLHTRLMVGADGFQSLLRKACNIHTVQWDYGQMAVVANLQLSEPTENNVAWQRFLPTGPIAMLPVSNGLNNLIWSTTDGEAKRLLQMDEEQFVDAVNQAFWSEDYKDPLAESVGKVFDNFLVSLGLEGSSSQQLPPTVVGVDGGKKGAFPLGLCHSTHYVKPRVALIGDAAHRMHPLAGQGVNAGFGDVTSLTNHLSQAIGSGADIGSISHLLKYETERQRHILPIMATVDALKRLYGSTFTPLILLRSLGLQATNALGPLKHQLVSHATV